MRASVQRESEWGRLVRAMPIQPASGFLSNVGPSSALPAGPAPAPGSLHYAATGVPEFWIEDLKHDLLHVYRNSGGGRYKTCLTFRRGDSISPLAFPDVVLKVADLLG